ncbi:MAG: hypothetical protein JSU74_07735 [Candidatus Zixiibacteriota bacterium]|nr:MAG: hypothetical protein JSU74_07735 [candidate division Zixibacteria bacterium]
MKIGLVVISLGAYFFIMGILGLARTDSFTPLYINGAVSAVTIWLGWLLGKNMRVVRNVTLAWLSVITLAMGYMTFGEVSAHSNPTIGSSLIFGSMGLFSLIVILLVRRAGRTR